MGFVLTVAVDVRHCFAEYAPVQARTEYFPAAAREGVPRTAVTVVLEPADNAFTATRPSVYFLVPVDRYSQAEVAGFRTEAVFLSFRVVRTAVPVEVAVVDAVTFVTVTVEAAVSADPAVARMPTRAAADTATARATAMVRLTEYGAVAGPAVGSGVPAEEGTETTVVHQGCAVSIARPGTRSRTTSHPGETR
ncbi:hypothetical protein [Curtobacterium sp. PhB25]|uniref:hypothetical protein n=1 Tax=Curtobacterium sp. PhB25 TaxID=2485205 RepID=UPI001065F045|nr:hypothetical protein [Curtobacterium sp. PhB25]